MSKRVIFLVGLPGSGKTHLMETNGESWKGYSLLDDPSTFATYEYLLKFMEEHGDLIIADPLLCLKWTQASAKKIFSGYVQSWLYWENNLEACLENIHNRNDARKISLDFMRSLSRQYYIPGGTSTEKIFRIS